VPKTIRRRRKLRGTDATHAGTRAPSAPRRVNVARPSRSRQNVQGRRLREQIAAKLDPSLPGYQFGVIGRDRLTFTHTVTRLLEIYYPPRDGPKTKTNIGLSPGRVYVVYKEGGKHSIILASLIYGIQ